MQSVKRICYNCFKEYDQGQKACPYCGYDHALNEEKFPYALKAGTVLNGQYIIGRVLGQGGFGITYLAMDDQLKVKVAIKEFLPEGMATRPIGTTKVSVFSGDREENFRYGAERFLDEARVLAKFTGNPNIAAVKCYFSENETAYFVMDYIEGISFKSYIQNKGGKIPYEDALRVLMPVLNALEAVHKEGFIHRDVTPDNIYITKNDEIKLLDFGSARYSLGDKSRSLDVVLKAGYAPKEQYVRRGKQGPYTDVYSVAACFYGAITGYLPPESLERMEEDSLVPPSTRGVKIPAYLEDAILKGLEVSPADRFQTAGEFLAALKVESKEEAKPVEQAAAGADPETVAVPRVEDTPKAVAVSRVEDTPEKAAIPRVEDITETMAVSQAEDEGKKASATGAIITFLKEKKIPLAACMAGIVLIAVIAGIIGGVKNSKASDPDNRLRAAMTSMEENKSAAVIDFVGILRSDNVALKDFMSTAISGDSDRLIDYIDAVDGRTYVGAGFTDLNGESFCFASIDNKVSAEVNTVSDLNYYQETIRKKSVVERVNLFKNENMLVFSVPVLFEDTLYSTAQLYYDLNRLEYGSMLQDPQCIAVINDWLLDTGADMWVQYLNEDQNAQASAFQKEADATALTMVVDQVDEDKKLELIAQKAADEAARKEAEAREKAAAEEAARKEEEAKAEKEAAEKEEKEKAEREAAEKAAAEQEAAEKAEKEKTEKEKAEKEKAEKEKAEKEAAAAKESVSKMSYYLVTSKYSANVIYTGQWKDGKPDGSGTATFSEDVSGRFSAGDTLTGTWVNGLLEGNGVYSNSSGSWQLHGYFVHGLKEGTVKTYVNGEYNGDWEFKNGDPIKTN